MFVWLDDREFNDFNFSSLFDPSLKPGAGPNEAMDWTPRPASFQSFQRVHGPRPIEYKD